MANFNDQIELAEAAVKLGRQVLQQGDIFSFSVHYYTDTWEFLIHDEQLSEPMAPEEAYSRFKQLLSAQPMLSLE